MQAICKGRRMDSGWIYVFTFWLYGSNVLAQQIPLQVDQPTLDLQQDQGQPPPQPQPPPPPVPVQQEATSAETNDNTNNMVPLDLNICSDANYRPVDILPGLRRSTELRTLQLGQTGVIWPMANRSIPVNADCYLQLSACSACQIMISWNAPLADNRVQSNPDQANERDKFGCESVWDFRDRQRCVDMRLVEADADQTTLKPYQKISLLNAPSQYRGQFVSSSYKLDLNLQFWKGDAERANALNGLFPLKYTVIDNTRLIHGRQSQTDLPTNYSDGFISSPRFPKTYPEGVTVNYTFINDDPEGAVRLVFTDFSLHYMSILKIIDTNGREIASTQSQYGSSQRPPALQSSGNILSLVFIANNYKHDIGFRANYRFVKEKTWLDRPSLRPCDKVYEDTGGTLTIENLNLDAYTYVDCIWILEKPRYAPIGFDKLYLKVEDFSVISGGKGLQLDVHAGRTSTNRRLLTIFGPKSSEQLAREQPQEGFISDTVQLAAAEKAAATRMEEDDSDTGFYLRLRGYLGSASGMSIVYAQFYRWATPICHDVTEFHCDNGRCISNRYQCDAHDHCGDFSDEVKCQGHGSKTRSGTMPGDGSDDAKEGSGFSLSGYTTTILLVAGLIGLTLVLLMVTVIVARVYRQKLLRRCSATARGNRVSDSGDHRDDGLGSLSGINNSITSINRSSSTAIMMAMDEQLGARQAPSLHQVGNRRLLMLPESDIGVLEAPPTYDDALKHPTLPPSTAATLLRTSQQNLPLSGINGSSRPASELSHTTTSGDGNSSATYAGPSSGQAPPSFDNPTFDIQPELNEDELNGPVYGHRRRDDSTCSSEGPVSQSDDEASSGSCTGSDLEVGSGYENGNVIRSDNSILNTGNESGTAQADNASPKDQPGEIGPTSTSTNNSSQPMRRPPVPLPRSSLITRLSQRNLSGMATDPSNIQATSDTLV